MSQRGLVRVGVSRATKRAKCESKGRGGRRAERGNRGKGNGKRDAGRSSGLPSRTAPWPESRWAVYSRSVARSSGRAPSERPCPPWRSRPPPPTRKWPPPVTSPRPDTVTNLTSCDRYGPASDRRRELAISVVSVCRIFGRSGQKWIFTRFEWTNIDEVYFVYQNTFGITFCATSRIDWSWEIITYRQLSRYNFSAITYDTYVEH